VINHSSNLHLQRAIVKYGLSAFVFYEVEFCNPSDLLAREQHYLDWLFSLPAKLRFNFCPTAGSLRGCKADKPEETKAKISAAKLNMSDETRAKMSASKSGEKHPRYGKGAPNALAVHVYSVDGTPVKSFTSHTAAAKWLNVARGLQFLDIFGPGRYFKGKYIILSSPLS
jgi:group I intron endonuclease